MKSNYGKGNQTPEFKQIFPAEAMTGNKYHDFAVYCAMLTAFKIISRKELEKVADLTPFQIRQQVAKTCKKIVQEHQGFIWLQETTNG